MMPKNKLGKSVGIVRIGRLTLSQQKKKYG
jgi:hypothetical protein